GVGPVVDPEGGDGRLLGAGGVPHVVRAADHDVAVVAPTLADLVGQVGQEALRLHRHEQFACPDAAGGEEHLVGRNVLGGDHRALLVDLLDRHPVPAPGGRGDGRDPVQRRDGEPAGGGGLGEV